MTETYDMILAGGVVVNHDGAGVRDVGVRAGRIAAIGRLDPGSAGETVDCSGLTVLPGVIDTQVHFREPGAEHKEDLESGSRAAVLGGVTAVFEMPNTDPPTVSAGALDDKLDRARGRMHCDHAFFMGGTRENARDLGHLETLPGCAGVKVFVGSSTGSLLVEEDEGIAEILHYIRRRAAFHAEDEPRLRERLSLREPGRPETHPAWRDETAALLATQRLLRLARAAGKRIHILHVSTAEEMALLANHKDIASVEVTPHHLTMSADSYARLGTKLQMNPPVRDGRHRAGLWKGLTAGVADILGSDHAPHTLEEKARPYPQSPSGMAGVQTLVPIMLDHVNAGRMSIERFVDMTSAGPARLFQIAGKGRVAVGYDADFTVVDMQRGSVITDEWIASRCGWTPYAGLTVSGWPVGAFVRGQRVMWDGDLVTAGAGAPVRFLETLPRG